jgi:hypothetical protein
MSKIIHTDNSCIPTAPAPQNFGVCDALLHQLKKNLELKQSQTAHKYTNIWYASQNLSNPLAPIFLPSLLFRHTSSSSTCDMSTPQRRKCVGHDHQSQRI